MKKDYSIWTPLKQEINNIEDQRLLFHEREIWHSHVGENIGSEQDGRGETFMRPILIIRKFNDEIFWGIPLTRTIKNLPFYFCFSPEFLSNADGNRSAILSQIRLLHAKRLRRLAGYISKEDFCELKRKLKALLP